MQPTLGYNYDYLRVQKSTKEEEHFAKYHLSFFTPIISHLLDSDHSFSLKWISDIITYLHHLFELGTVTV